MSKTPSPDGRDESPFRGATGLEAEVEIIWLEALAPLDYVRETYLPTSTWRARPDAPPGTARLVGYAIHAPPDTTGLKANALRERRVFHLKPGDRALDPEGVYEEMVPAEAVDPQTVAPGKAGELPGRFRGGQSKNRPTEGES